MKSDTSASKRKHIVLRRTLNQVLTSNLSARDELKTPPKQISQRSKAQPLTLLDEAKYDEQKISLSPRV